VIFTGAYISSGQSLVRVESHLSNGLTCFTIVDLSEMAGRESRKRVHSAIINARIDFPDKRMTINPGLDDLPKRRSRIAIGTLSASG
jgi:magnesium chelatase family protein